MRQSADPEVVEMIPQDRPANRTSNAWAISQGAARQSAPVRWGGLFYDNMHFVNGDEDNPLQGQPKRFSLREISLR